MANNISPLASVSPYAKLGDNITVGPFSVIEDDVEIGSNCVIRPHVSILNGARIGRDNVFYEGSIIAADPQDFRWKGEKSYVVIGDGNVIREQVIINRSIKEDGETRLGDNNNIMAQTHIGHDTVMTNHCTLGNGCLVAGNVHLSHCAILSSGVIVHEGCNIGAWALIKGGARVTGNVPPYVIMAHNPISYFGVNAYLLKRGKKSDDAIDDIAKCYRHLYQSGTSVFNAVNRIKEDVAPGRERDAILQFIEDHNENIVATPIETLY